MGHSRQTLMQAATLWLLTRAVINALFALPWNQAN
jgi:hypothetical protein